MGVMIWSAFFKKQQVCGLRFSIPKIIYLLYVSFFFFFFLCLYVDGFFGLFLNCWGVLKLFIMAGRETEPCLYIMS